MCLNCGCGQPNEDHGKPENITAAALQRAADANGQSLRESAQHIVETVGLIDRPAGDDRAETGSSASEARAAGEEGLAQPAGPSGATKPGGHGTPASES